MCVGWMVLRRGRTVLFGSVSTTEFGSYNSVGVQTEKTFYSGFDLNGKPFSGDDGNRTHDPLLAKQVL